MKSMVARHGGCFWLCMIMTVGLNGCSVYRGETIGLTAFYKGAYDAFHIGLFDENNNLWGFSQYDRRDKFEERPLVSPVFTRDYYTPDNNRTLPQRVKLVWLTTPRGGGLSDADEAKIAELPYPPEKVLLTREQMMGPFISPHPGVPKVYGPFEIDIRSRIPEIVLKAVRGSWSHGLGVTIEFTEDYHRMNWALWDRADKLKTGNPNTPVCVGGDLNVAPEQKTLEWEKDGSRFTIPIWPHCTI